MPEVTPSLRFAAKWHTGACDFAAKPEPGLDAIVNLQEVRGQTKPYQIRQFLRLVERYGVRLEKR